MDFRPNRLSIDHTETELSELAGKYADVTEIKDAADYQLVKRGGIELGKVRVSIEKAGKAARDDANKFRTAVIAEEKRLKGIIQPEEDRLKDMRKEHDTRAAREAAEKLRIETERKDGIERKIAGIKGYLDGVIGETADNLSVMVNEVESIEITEQEYQEYFDNAMLAKNAVVRKLTTLLDERRAFEEQQREQARIASEQAARQAELDKQAAEQREREEAERRKIEAEREKVRKEQEAVEAARRAEEEKRLAAERAEAEKVRQAKERLEREARKREEAEERRKAEEAEAARQEALRPEKDRLIDWLKKLRFIDGIELHNADLVSIQSAALSELEAISTRYMKRVEDA